MLVWVSSVATAVILVANNQANNAGMIEFVSIICFMYVCQFSRPFNVLLLLGINQGLG